jgi:hypothetical protein
MLAFLGTLLWSSGLPLRSMPGMEDMGGVWRIVQPIDAWIVARVVELIVVMLCLLVLIYGSGKEWRRRWLILMSVPVVLVWCWWGLMLG